MACTHATEVTGALNQRLRPLGHAILSPEKNIVQVMIGTNATCFDYSERAAPNRLAYEVDIKASVRFERVFFDVTRSKIISTKTR